MSAIKGRVGVLLARRMTTTAAATALLVTLTMFCGTAARAQTEGWLLGPGSKGDKTSTVVPTNCVKSTDGSITCDTKLETPNSGSPARPYYNPFND